MAHHQTVTKRFPRFYVDADGVYTWGVKDRTTGEWVATELRDPHSAEEARAEAEDNARSKGEQI
jgi:hypothetical protein